MLLVALSLAGCLDQGRTPDPPTVQVQGDTIEVSDMEPRAEAVLYDEAGDEVSRIRANDDGNATFTGVDPGRYHVTQVFLGTESDRSRLLEVQVSIKAPSATGEVLGVTVTGARAQATVVLYDAGDQQVATENATGQGRAEFTQVEPGTGYYVTQIVDGTESNASAAFSVKPKAPSLDGGRNQVTVSNARAGAEVRVYGPDGTVANTAQAGTDGSVAITGIPAGSNVQATQVVNGAESPKSQGVKVTGLNAESGVGQITVTGASSGATVTLYDAGDQQVDQKAAGAGGQAVFTPVPVGTGYYATATVGGSESDASNTAASLPPAPVVIGDVAQLKVTQLTAGAEVEVTGPGGFSTTQTVTSDTLTLTGGLVPGSGYVATQTINGATSPDSNSGTVLPKAPTAQGANNAVVVTDFRDGATIRVYNQTGTEPDPANDTRSNTLPNATGSSVTVTGISSGPSFYATQVVNAAESPASNVVAVSGQFKPQATGGVLQVTIDAQSNVDIELYRATTTPGTADPANDTLIDSVEDDADGSHTFDVPANTGYYGLQVKGGTPSLPSDLVNAKPPAPTASGELANQVDVNDARAGVTVRLFEVGTNTAFKTGTTDATGFHAFQEVPDGDWVVRQVVNGSTSPNSNQATVSDLGAPQVDGLVEQVNASGEPGATYRLYRSGPSVLQKATDTDEDGNVTFTGLSPNTGYTVTQARFDVAGSDREARLESGDSPSVGVKPQAPVIEFTGNQTVHVNSSKSFAGALVKLWKGNASETPVEFTDCGVNRNCRLAPNGWLNFTHVPASDENPGNYDLDWRATITVNGARSAFSDFHNVTGVILEGGENEVTVRSARVPGEAGMNKTTIELYAPGDDPAVDPPVNSVELTNDCDTYDSITDTCIEQGGPEFLTHTFTEDAGGNPLDADTGYFVRWKFNHFTPWANLSNRVTVTNPGAPSLANDAPARLNASNVETGADVKLYRLRAKGADPDPGLDSLLGTCTEGDTADNCHDPEHSDGSLVSGVVVFNRTGFPDMVPDDARYYVTQTEPGEAESDPSNVVALQPEAPDLVGEVGKVQVEDYYKPANTNQPNVNITLFDGTGAITNWRVIDHTGPTVFEFTKDNQGTADPSDDTDLRIDTGYYVQAQVENQTSPQSDPAPVRPPRVTIDTRANDGWGSTFVNASNAFDQGVTVLLFDADGNQLASGTANSDLWAKFTFQNDGLRAGFEYRARQRVNGSLSPNSTNLVDLPPTALNDTDDASLGPHEVKVVAAQAGARVNLYKTSDKFNQVGHAFADEDGEVLFTSLDPDTDYCVRQDDDDTNQPGTAVDETACSNARKTGPP